MDRSLVFVPVATRLFPSARFTLRFNLFTWR